MCWKITDFTLTTKVEEAGITEMFRGTPKYQPPELTSDFEKGGYYTKKVDIWAIGCILYKFIFANCDAFGSPKALYDYWMSGGKTLHISRDSEELCAIFAEEEMREFIVCLIYQLLDVDPDKRPPANVIIGTLEFAFASRNSRTIQETTVAQKGGKSREEKHHRIIGQVSVGGTAKLTTKMITVPDKFVGVHRSPIIMDENDFLWPYDVELATEPKQLAIIGPSDNGRIFQVATGKHAV
jgi:serine/threonine protein kinase